MTRAPRSVLGTAAVLLCAAALAGCGRVDARTGLAASQPQAPPVRASTPYTDALTCLDQMMAQQPRGPNVQRFIAAGTIPDATGRLSPGLRDMVTSAFVRANRMSRAFVPVEALTLSQVPIPSSGAATTTSGTVISQGVAPTGQGMLQVHGSLSQADRAVQAQTAQAGIGSSENQFGISANSDIANVAVDLHLTQADTRQILFSVSNAMTVRNRSRGANADFSIRGVGINFEIAFDEREGLHQAVRTLVELSVLELIGQAAQVPYWHCLQTNRNNPAVQRQIIAWFQGMSAAQVDDHVRRRLRALGYSVPEPPASAAGPIGEFQRQAGLVANGQPGFETFAALADAQLSTAPVRPSVVDAQLDTSASLVTVPTSRPTPIPSADPTGAPSIRVDVNEITLPQPVLQLRIELDRGAHLVCFYRDETGGVWRVYPNRHNTEARPRGNRPFLVPANTGHRPVIQPSRMTPDVGFLCAASARDWATSLPSRFWGTDLTRLGGVDFPGLSAALREAGGAEVGITETTSGRPSGQWMKLDPQF